MSSTDGDRQEEAQGTTDQRAATAKRKSELALIRTWRVELHTRGFSDQQAARLIMIKLLYLRRSLRG
jgi:hypothetical protein